MSRIHLVSLSSEIYEDSYGEGEGDFTGCGIQHVAIGRTFADMNEAAMYLHEMYNLSADTSDYDDMPGETCLHLFTSITVADHSDAQNGGWFEPTQQEYDLWKAGEIKLYSENFAISYLNVI